MEDAGWPSPRAVAFAPAMSYQRLFATRPPGRGHGRGALRVALVGGHSSALRQRGMLIQEP